MLGFEILVIEYIMSINTEHMGLFKRFSLCTVHVR